MVKGGGTEDPHKSSRLLWCPYEKACLTSKDCFFGNDTVHTVATKVLAREGSVSKYCRQIGIDLDMLFMLCYMAWRWIYQGEECCFELGTNQ